MTWKEIEAAWHDLVDGILAQWPAMSAEHVLTIAGDQQKFIRYIAETHELTLAEAAEAMEIWVLRMLRTRQGC